LQNDANPHKLNECSSEVDLGRSHAPG